MRNWCFLLVLLSLTSFGQEVKGYLYDSDGRVPDFEIRNVTQNSSSRSDSNAYFKIPAKPGDTLIFNSIVYDRYALKVDSYHFEEEIVVVLDYNSLEEVHISSNIRKPTKIEDVDEELSAQIREDIVRNPHLYEPSRGNMGYLIHKFLGLFTKHEKDKNKEDDPVLSSIGAKDFEILFEKDDVLNKNFIQRELGIPEEFYGLFLEYLASKEYSSFLLKKEQKLDLINAIYEAGKEYTAVINTFKKVN